MEIGVESEKELIEVLKNSPDIDPDKHDGSYELVREIVRTYKNSDTARKHGYDANDLNAVWFMCTGAGDTSINFRKNRITNSNLSDEEKKNMVALLENIWDKAQRGEYSNTPKGQIGRVGMFTSGFSTFKMKEVDQERAPKEFIQMAIEILDEQDEEHILSIVEKYLEDPWKGFQAATLSVFLHCLKPTVFPIVNGNLGVGGALYEALDIKLKNYTKANSYIANARIIRDFRDANFTFKNYRVLDLASAELSESDEANARIIKWEIVSETCATRKYDQTVKSQKHCYLTPNVHPFFEVVGFKVGDKKDILVTYEDTEYTCEIKGFPSKNQKNIIIHLVFNKIKPFEAYLKDLSEKELLTQKLVFEKTGPDKYRLSMQDKDATPDIEIIPEPKTKIVPEKKQVIFYGPPGTGKTYNSIIRAHEIIYGFSDKENPITYPDLQAKLCHNSKQDVDINKISTWLDAIMWAFHEIKKEKIQMEEIKNSNIIKKFGLTRNNNSIGSTISNTLQREAPLDSLTVHVKNKTGRELFDNKGKNNWYLTQKGKEYLDVLIGDFNDNSQTSSSQFTFVTFHQSYSYEDFVEGIRPSLDNDAESQIRYEVKPGIFKDICNKASLDLNNNYVLVIDEINRGNISKIFGELITLLEDNKRSGEKEAITVKLPYSNNYFSVPKNVYIIGTMNSTDKSIALVDVALRRRFHFERMNVNYSLIKNEDAKKMLEELNEIICALKNPDFEIGHSYFLNIDKIDEKNEELRKVFDTKILPLIEEYFFNDWEALATILGSASIEIKKKKKIIWDEDSQEFKKAGEYDQISGRCINYSKNIFENTLNNLKILNKYSDSTQKDEEISTESLENNKET